MEEGVELFYGVDTSDMSVSQLNRLFREPGGMEYAYALDAEISRIVNGAV